MVDITGRLIQENHAGSVKRGSGQAEKLLLSGREARGIKLCLEVSTLSNDSLDAHLGQDDLQVWAIRREAALGLVLSAARH